MSALITPGKLEWRHGKPRASLVAILFIGLVTALTAAPTASREYDLKAAFIYNFTAFVEWPDTAFPEASSPFVIGVLGEDPFGSSLEEIVLGERFNGRPMVVKHFTRPEGAAGCQIVFVSPSEKWRLREILDFLHTRPVLTVSDIPNFAEEGGLIGFTTDTRVRISINTAPLRAANLAMSPKLLRLAKVAANLSPP